MIHGQLCNQPQQPRCCALQIINIALIVAAATAPCGTPLIALGYLGEQVEVAEVGGGGGGGGGARSTGGCRHVPAPSQLHFEHT
jgi:hypothetical protein